MKYYYCTWASKKSGTILASGIFFCDERSQIELLFEIETLATKVANEPIIVVSYQPMSDSEGKANMKRIELEERRALPRRGLSLVPQAVQSASLMPRAAASLRPKLKLVRGGRDVS